MEFSFPANLHLTLCFLDELFPRSLPFEFLLFFASPSALGADIYPPRAWGMCVCAGLERTHLPAFASFLPFPPASSDPPEDALGQAG